MEMQVVVLIGKLIKDEEYGDIKIENDYENIEEYFKRFIGDQIKVTIEKLPD